MSDPTSNRFFERPILNSPYEYPHEHWELDPTGQPTGRIAPKRRRAEFITPIAKPKKHRASARQAELNLDTGPSTKKQKHDLTSIINEQAVDAWRTLPGQSQVTPVRPSAWPRSLGRRWQQGRPP